jgi:hypothetical protein
LHGVEFRILLVLIMPSAEGTPNRRTTAATDLMDGDLPAAVG